MLQDLNGVCHNPDNRLSSFLWQLQAGLQPNHQRLDPLLDFEEHFQKVFLRRGLIIYCTTILDEIEQGGTETGPLVELMEATESP
jgi:hypothetical protein